MTKMSHIDYMVSQMSDQEVCDHKLLDLTLEDTYSYLISDELQDETDEILLYFLCLASRRITIAINDDDRLKFLIKVIDRRLDEIKEILEIDEDQVLQSLNYINETVLERLYLFVFSTDEFLFYKMLNYVMNMEEENRNLQNNIDTISSLMECTFKYNNESILRTILNNDGWIRLYAILLHMISETPDFQNIVDNEYSNTEIFEFLQNEN